MKLYLVQHGEALAKDVDPDRALSDQGKRDVRALAAFLEDAGITVERVWHSGKLRAEQTAQLLSKAVLGSGGSEAIKGISPRDPVEAFISDADVWQQDTLVVGHLPFMSRLVSLLATGDAEQTLVTFIPGSAACLERDDSDAWSLLWMVRPEVLGSRRSVA